MDAFKNKLYKPGLLLLAIGLLFAVSGTQRGLNAFRDERGLTRVAHLENAPPVLAFTTVALGGFRGLIANVLWSRVSDLQMEGKYFEMVQLSDWISKLTPTFDAVWVHLAWNMSYNISVKFEDHADRWLWVQRGIELLRDEGLQYDPNSVELYRELAWHFQHKLGQNLDDAHLYYKMAWATEMQRLLGEPPDWERLIHPQTEEEKQITQTLKDDYKLDPAFMKKVDETYGPLEWRLPETHAIYWAMKGLEEVERRYRNDPKGYEQVYERELIQLRRVIYQSMQLAFRRGRLIRVEAAEDVSRFDFGPNLDMIDNANRAYEEMMAQDEGWRDHISNGHKNMLEEAVYFLYTYNRSKEAARWLAYLKENYPQSDAAGMSLEEYAVQRVTEIAGGGLDRNRIKLILEGLIRTAFVNLAIGQEDRATGMDRLAQKVYNNYQSQMDTIENPDSRIRVELPPFRQMKRDVLDQLLAPGSGELSPYLQNVLRTELGLPPPSREPAPEDEREESSGQPTTTGPTRDSLSVN